MPAAHTSLWPRPAAPVPTTPSPRESAPHAKATGLVLPATPALRQRRPAHRNGNHAATSAPTAPALQKVAAATRTKPVPAGLPPRTTPAAPAHPRCWLGTLH